MVVTCGYTTDRAGQVVVDPFVKVRFCDCEVETGRLTRGCF